MSPYNYLKLINPKPYLEFLAYTVAPKVIDSVGVLQHILNQLGKSQPCLFFNSTQVYLNATALIGDVIICTTQSIMLLMTS